MVLYVQDIDAVRNALARRVSGAAIEKSTELTLAEKAIVIADRKQGKLELHLRNGSIHDLIAQRSHELHRHHIRTKAICRFVFERAEVGKQIHADGYGANDFRFDVHNGQGIVRSARGNPAALRVSRGLHGVRVAGGSAGGAAPTRRTRHGIHRFAAVGLRLLLDVYCRRGLGERRKSFAGDGNLGGKFPHWTGGAGAAAGDGTDPQLDEIVALV